MGASQVLKCFFKNFSNSFSKKSENSTQELEDLKNNTKFNQNELQKMFQQFQRETPQGTLNKQEFKEVMKKIGVFDVFLQDLIFDMFDTEKKGSLTFVEFIKTFSKLTRGSTDEKLEFIFQIYDRNKDGFLDKEELLPMLVSFYNLLGPFVSFTGKKYETPQELLDEFFEIMDEDNDGKVSLLDYKSASLKNINLVQGLQLFPK